MEQQSSETKSFETCSIGPIQLWNESPSIDVSTFSSLVSVSVFRSLNGYRDTRKYAEGLERLVKQAQETLPSALVRIYFDDSVAPEALAQDEAPEGAAWAEVFRTLATATNVQLLRFRCEAAAVEGTPCHVDMFGTLLRFLPFFKPPEGTPPWCYGPRSDAMVLCFDADYSNMSFERLTLALAAWFASQCDRLSKGDIAEDAVPHMIAYSNSGSTAPRHLPLCGLPAALAGCIAMRKRYPLSWFIDFLKDALKGPGSGGSFGAGRYCKALHRPEALNYTYKRRNIEAQQSCFPFGIDEFFFSSVMKPMVLAQPEKETWMYAIVPSIDRVVQTMTRAVLSVVADQPQLLKEGPLRHLVEEGAKAIGDAKVATLPETIADGNAMAEELFNSRLNRWPKAFADVVGLYQPYAGSFDTFFTPSACQVMKSLTAMLSCFVEALSVPTIAASISDQELAIQNLNHFAEANGRAIAATVFHVGEGKAKQLECSDGLGKSFLNYLGEVGMLSPQTLGELTPAQSSQPFPATATTTGRGTSPSAVRRSSGSSGTDTSPPRQKGVERSSWR